VHWEEGGVMIQKLSWAEFQELCLLWEELGERDSDLLDFIHWIQAFARNNDLTHAKVLEICRHIQPRRTREQWRRSRVRLKKDRWHKVYS